MTDTVVHAMKKSLEVEAQVLAQLALDTDYDLMSEAVDRLIKAPYVITTASGTSGIAATKFAHTLCCVKRPAKFVSPVEANHGGMGCIRRDDVLVLASRGGQTSELYPTAEYAVSVGASLIVVTENLSSPLAEAATLVLPISVPQESDPLGLMATTSFVATIGIFDALIAGIIQKTGFSAEEFGGIHPGGAVGARLNVAVED